MVFSYIANIRKTVFCEKSSWWKASTVYYMVFFSMHGKVHSSCMRCLANIEIVIYHSKSWTYQHLFIFSDNIQTYLIGFEKARKENKFPLFTLCKRM